MKLLAKRADLRTPQDVEIAIARYKKKDGKPAANAYKTKLCDAYGHYCKHFKIEWEKPTYTDEPKSIQPPTQERCSMLIAAAHGEMSIKINISTQTGMRPCEVQGEKGLQAKDVHPDQKTITPRSRKGCNARPPIPITQELCTQLQTYITEHQLKPDDTLFAGNTRRYGEHYRRFRNNLAEKLKDPTIATIRLYDLRHYYCTKQLRRTQNAEIVRQLMGHKHLNTTQKYMHLLAGNSGEWIVEGTTDKERAKQLLAEDFQYQLTAPDGTMLFRKPK